MPSNEIDFSNYIIIYFNTSVNVNIWKYKCKSWTYMSYIQLLTLTNATLVMTLTLGLWPKLRQEKKEMNQK
jgi:hypothetical protein